MLEIIQRNAGKSTIDNRTGKFIKIHAKPKIASVLEGGSSWNSLRFARAPEEISRGRGGTGVLQITKLCSGSIEYSAVSYIYLSPFIRRASIIFPSWIITVCIYIYTCVTVVFLRRVFWFTDLSLSIEFQVDKVTVGQTLLMLHLNPQYCLSLSLFRCSRI